jgi:RNA polymerase sigma factor (sigma-70 family)
VRDVEDDAAELSEEGSWFDAFTTVHESRLRRALVAANGVQIGNDACADAIAWAWEHRDRVMGMEHPVAYLFRVGQSAARRYRRWRREVCFPPESESVELPDGLPRLDAALSRLTRRQRTVVILVHAHGWSYSEVAETLMVTDAVVRNQLHRGMKRLRNDMETP